MDLKPIEIFIDADACPVKDETYKVAQRYGLKTWVVSNAFMQIPASPLISALIRSDASACKCISRIHSV